MQKELAKFIQDTFAPYGDFPARNDVTRELLSNLEEKYKDLKSQGKSDQEAYRITIESFGDVSEIMDEIGYKKTGQNKDKSLGDSIRSTINEYINNTVSTVHKFKGVELEESDLSDVNLTEANFSGSAIQKANFSGANLTDAKFAAAAISDANFTGAQLTDTVFKSSDIRNANFNEAKFIRTQFKSSGVKGATFKHTVISGANFKTSDFTDASFEGSDITDTIFISSSLTRTSFKDATLRNVSLHYSEVKDTLFDGTKMDKVTYAFLKKTKANLENVIII